jgi:hypothetical protein
VRHAEAEVGLVPPRQRHGLRTRDAPTPGSARTRMRAELRRPFTQD